MSANYNLYLSTLPALASTPGFITADFTFQPVSNFRGRRDSGLGLRSPDGPAGGGGIDDNLLRNGGFERTTILTRWPASQNCSTNTRSCSRRLIFGGELFSLCSWAVVSPPEVVYDRAPLWQAAEGVSSLLLSNRASVNQSFPSLPATEYRLSFSMAGVLAASRSQDAFVLCSNASGISVTVQIDSSQLRAVFSLAADEVSRAGGDTLWVTRTLLFTSSRTTNATTITIASVGSSACGPVIDSVKVAAVTSSDGHKSRNTAGIAAGAAAGALVLLGLLLLGLGFLRKRHQWDSALLLNLTTDLAAQNVKVYSYAQLEKATANWSTLLGEGGFSKVYRGDFPDGSLGAVEVEKSRRSKSSVFKKELALFLRVSHRNLVNLIGFCAEKAHPILVFEFLPHGSLYDRLHKDNPDQVPLPWLSRMRIAYQLAAALKYLHHGTSPPIGHRDIKSANVLLTANDSAKLADFGLSKAAEADATVFLTVQTDVKGSLGYLDPKYVRSGVYSLKSDVYSYGVVLLELLTGHPAIMDMDLLSFWAAKYINEPLIAHQMLDARLNGDYDTSDLHILVDLVKMCVQDDAQLRPSMQQVVSFLADSHFSGCPPATTVTVPETVPETISNTSPDSSMAPSSTNSSSQGANSSSHATNVSSQGANSSSQGAVPVPSSS